ncbi:MAG: MBL fold metallo-hydrolase [Myxococcaceae bacterium]|nr:MAG: MBL fold metallo-hydrolase [Myxococcaceae bacterium]
MYTTRLRIIHFDVSQGESSLISLLGLEEDFHVLIDGGRKCRGRYVARCLRRLDIDHLDAIVCTHFDNDHHEGLVPVIEARGIGIGRLLIPKFGHNQEKFDGLKTACEAQGVDWEVAKVNDLLINSGGCQLKIIHVGTPDLRDDNTASIACLLTMNQFTYYTGGDLPWDMEERLTLPAHVCSFKVGHHGAETSTSARFVAALNPSAAFISAGRHAHGHPRQEILDSLRDQDTVQRVYSTNCVHPRQGFHDEDTLLSPHAKGLACSNRTNGVLGHIVVYTDDKLSRQHTDSKVGYFVLRPPPEGHGPWRAYKHICSNRRHLAKQCSPGGIVHLRDDEYPEFSLEALSPSIRAKRARTAGPFTFAPLLTLTEQERRTEYRPGSPIHNFVQDPPNFTVVEAPQGAPRAPKRKAAVLDSEHADTAKRTGACVGCNERRGRVPLDASNQVDCVHDKGWYVCSDCRPLYRKGFDCEQ